MKHAKLGLVVNKSTHLIKYDGCDISFS